MPALPDFLQPLPTSPARRRFLLTLYARRHDAVFLRRATARIGDWEPMAHCCAGNVDYWVRHNPDYRRVDGFLMLDYRPVGLDFVRFLPHCALEDRSGVLVDITPHHASEDYPFIRNMGTRAEFMALMDGERFGLDLILP